MTHAIKLFGDITAEQTEKGTYIVLNREQLVSPFEYTQIRQLTPKCYRLLRSEGKKYDLIFSSGAMQSGFDFAYEMEKIGRKRKKKSWIAVILKNGTGVYDDSGNFLAFIPGPHYIAIADDKFILALVRLYPEPYVKVYAMWGEFLAEGFLSEALQKAKEKMQIA